MINHVSIGVRDLARANRFYDAALKPLGYACLSEDASSGAVSGGRLGRAHGTADQIMLFLGAC